ncbi:hypothetical protein C0Q70_17883 [Pomacea canaliculata]|uniref:MADF domain-containing protein n=1 Tax=Pomacea canaliculata TaxID=400727 RepID=A0A2T7NLP1_POMCA|nr:hypothetical protein C0Q70_17883 [Pomacea canaliculata]
MQCPEYTQRNAKQAAFRSIVNGMRLETGIFLTADQVIAKIRNIRAQYGRELKKTLESDKTGIPYRSQWRWFNFLDSFLRSHFPKKDDDDDDISEADKEAEKDVEVTGTPTSVPPIKVSADDSDDNADEIDDISDSVSDAPAANSSTSAPVQNLSFTKNRERPQAKCRAPQNHHPISLRSHDPKPQPKVVGPASTPAMRLINDVSLQSVTPERTRKRSRSSAFGPAVSLNSPGSERMPSIPASLSHTLHLMQTLMATTLSSQDHPSFVFAKHISNELDLITDYRRRKKCMIAIQEVILQYQMQEDQMAAVKDERDLSMIFTSLSLHSGLLP